MDDDCCKNVKQVHCIPVILRRFLRTLDPDGDLISQVIIEEDKARNQLRGIKTTEFLTEERKDQIDMVFGNRVENEDGSSSGSRIRIRPFSDVHYTAWLLDTVRCTPNFDDYMEHFMSHAYRFSSSENLDKESHRAFFPRLVIDFRSQANEWIEYRNRHAHRRCEFMISRISSRLRARDTMWVGGWTFFFTDDHLETPQRARKDVVLLWKVPISRMGRCVKGTVRNHQSIRASAFRGDLSVLESIMSYDQMRVQSRYLSLHQYDENGVIQSLNPDLGL